MWLLYDMQDASFHDLQALSISGTIGSGDRHPLVPFPVGGRTRSIKPLQLEKIRIELSHSGGAAAEVINVGVRVRVGGRTINVDAALVGGDGMCYEANFREEDEINRCLSGLAPSSDDDSGLGTLSINSSDYYRRRIHVWFRQSLTTPEPDMSSP